MKLGVWQARGVCMCGGSCSECEWYHMTVVLCHISTWFVAYLDYTLHIKKIRVSSKIPGYFALEIVPKTLDFVNLATARAINNSDSNWSVVDKTWQWQRIWPSNVNSQPACWSHSASSFVHSVMVDWAWCTLSRGSVGVSWDLFMFSRPRFRRLVTTCVQLMGLLSHSVIRHTSCLHQSLQHCLHHTCNTHTLEK